MKLFFVLLVVVFWFNVIALLLFYFGLVLYSKESLYYTSEDQKLLVYESNKNKAPTSASDFTCMPLDGDFFASLLEHSDPVYLFMPAKSGGTSIKAFVDQCMGQSNHHVDNFFNDKTQYKPFLLSTLHPPKLVANHLLYDPELLPEFVINSSKRTTTIFLYREETDRLGSAIKQVVIGLCTREETNWIALSNTEPRICTIQETTLVNEIIEPRMGEIGFSNSVHINCKLWDTLDQVIHSTTSKNFAFVHYKQADTLQRAFVQRFCKGIDPVKVNSGEIPDGQIYNVALNYNTNTTTTNATNVVVSLDDWIQAKLKHMEFAMQIPGSTCQKKMFHMEEALAACQNTGILYNPTS